MIKKKYYANAGQGVYFTQSSDHSVQEKRNTKESVNTVAGYAILINSMRIEILGGLNING